MPGIALGFAAGAVAIVSRDESLEPMLAVPFGIGMGLTLDESALLLELEDVYWTQEGLLSVQITLGDRRPRLAGSRAALPQAR